ncbi:uncharacterized protein LOC121735646 [Aricia agestis]|uniref:uncharacterized protein LOC121735646 n=1 Tax=Aricia agestis TaxID=91739 RepID=UPI001C205CEC|nr:uncharacterized protein LOC121735646 [Aricia agestis]
MTYGGVKVNEKKQAFYCSKVCPLYCPDLKDMDKPDEKRTRRHAGYEYYEPEIYEDFPPYIDADDFEEFPYHFYPRFHHKKTTSTTTQKTTTTEEPTLICQVCKKKCKD